MTPIDVGVAALAAFWLGLVVAISFIEAPLKFRAPGVTIPVGLAIGRLVFRALNAVECVLASALLLLMVLGNRSTGEIAAVIAACVCLAIQLAAVRPAMMRRSNVIRDGAEYAGRSRVHLAYVAVECVKALALVGVVTFIVAAV
ncbi:hypothetical protein [Mycobacteroides salmoniphilum]|uniref:Transmembrane protein n=1 Tax=Mycobacteroides salmoniphilum TaxID=404941 RepID=A0A4R8SQ52_9MYCO|nr:hypothetical protein [Mycobacteroides salmoniphilum]TDZ91357.1 hypothetical protein CCUG62472_04616 [Mycobacteroides salmoniphilum]TEA01233.1 hypothetical protein CCUG60884_03982 [Mycobacteroides salmoniphilum]